MYRAERCELALEKGQNLEKILFLAISTCKDNNGHLQKSFSN